jgi:hypothetical protein
MIKIFGEFTDEIASSQEYLIIGFSPSSIPLKQRWRNNGLSADFLADYLTTFFPPNENDPSSSQKRTEIKGSVSYIVNELLENAMKYNNPDSSHPISIQLHLSCDRIIILISNSIHPDAIAPFQTYIQNLLNCDLQELYVQQLEKSALDRNSSDSGLGLLTIINDYGAKLSWKFATLDREPPETIVTTIAELFV